MCFHKWEIISQCRNEVRDVVFSTVRYETDFLLKCKKCGDIKGKTVDGWFNELISNIEN